MRYFLLMIAVVALVGCGESDITQCYWCKEDIKNGALICKHCGKTPNENRADQEPDKTTGSGQNTKPPVDTWASKSHPDQVTIREVETDKDAYASNFDLFGENLRLGPKAKGGFIIKGTIRLTTYFPKDEWILAKKDGTRVNGGKFFGPRALYAFEIKDHTGSAYAYGLKSNPDIKSLREQLLRERSGRLKGFFKLGLTANFPIHDYPKVHALFDKVITEGIDEGTSSSAPSKNNEPKSTQPSVGEAEKDSLQKKERSWPWWKYPIAFIAGCFFIWFFCEALYLAHGFYAGTKYPKHYCSGLSKDFNNACIGVFILWGLFGFSGWPGLKPESLSATEINTEIQRVFSSVEGEYAALGRAIGLQGTKHIGTEQDLYKLLVMLDDKIGFALPHDKYTEEDREAIRERVKELGGKKVGLDDESSEANETLKRQISPNQRKKENEEMGKEWMDDFKRKAIYLILAAVLFIFIHVGLGGVDYYTNRNAEFREAKKKIIAAAKAGKMSERDADKKLADLKKRFRGGDYNKDAKISAEESAKEIIKEVPFQPEWREIMRDNIGLYRKLPEPAKSKLEELIPDFLGTVEFIPQGYPEITEQMRICVTAEACILILGRSLEDYRHLKTVEIWKGGPGGKKDCAGDADRIQVRLNWDESLRGAKNPEDNYNVTIHEFAHVIDFADDGVANSIPLPENAKRRKKWEEFVHREKRQILGKRWKDNKHVVEKYGATKDAEFFSCATESFFEKPEITRRNHQEIYGKLKNFYQLDPAMWGMEPVVIPNSPEAEAAIKAAIRDAAGKPTGKLTNADLEKVTQLYLNNNQITDLSALKELTQLTDLCLYGNQVSDVSPLKELKQLKGLNLDRNKLTKLPEGLEKLTQLSKLSLVSNQIDVRALVRALIGLKELNLCDNKIRDVSALKELKQLTRLLLQNNPDLSEVKIAELQKALPKCKIEHLSFHPISPP